MRSLRCCNRGFSLLEVMIALAIVAIALVSLLGLSNRSLLLQNKIENLTRATLLAQQIISEQKLDRSKTAATWAPQADSFVAPFEDFHWQISYQDTLISRVKQITVTVTWGAETGSEQVQIVSFVPDRGSG